MGRPDRLLAWAVLASCAGVSGLVAFYQALAIGTMGVVAPIAGLAGLVRWPRACWQGSASDRSPRWVRAAILLGVVPPVVPNCTRTPGETTRAPAILAAVLFGVSLLGIARGSRLLPVMTMVGMRITAVLVLCLALLIEPVTAPSRRTVKRQRRVRAAALPDRHRDSRRQRQPHLRSIGSEWSVGGDGGPRFPLYPVATALLAGRTTTTPGYPVRGVAFAVAGTGAGFPLVDRHLRGAVSRRLHRPGIGGGGHKTSPVGS